MHKSKTSKTAPIQPPAPPLAKRSSNRKSTIRSGRTIAANREQLETANERAAARKKAKRKNNRRVLIVSFIFVIVFAILLWLLSTFFAIEDDTVTKSPQATTTPTPTAPIVDEDAPTTGSEITSRMKEYIALAESDFADLGYQVEKTVLPTGSVREVDFYLQGQPGYIKTVIDRGSAVSVEDADRVIRYLTGEGITSFQYIDVRVKGKAFYLP